jgi:tetratricopeptide (TPR) repeat protein
MKLILNFSIPILLLFFISCSQPNEMGNEPYPADAYVGGAACIECHETEYKFWQGSHHDWAMRLPYDSTVLGDFDNVSFVADEEEYFFFRKDSAYYVRAKNESGDLVDYPIAYTFGVTPLQQYLIKFPDGKIQTLRATWDTDSNCWFNQYAGTTVPHGDWLHWQEGGQRWNTMCAECHSTNLVKGYNLSNDSFNTTYDDINVNCESCHGPGGAHMNWAAKEDTVGDPMVEYLGFERMEQMNMCAGCHARRTKLTEVMEPGVAFDDQFRVQTINDNFYHPDGQILEEDYVFGSFTQSKMFHKDVKCTNCHNPHSMQTVYPGNLLCMQCHEVNYDTKEHHFHEMGTEGASCIECHMTGDVYMGNDFRRDHSFRVPRPDQSVAYNTPNACVGCHTDQTNQWAADWIVEWYGPERADHFSDYLLMASRPPYSDANRDDILQFINNMDYPAIARATALEYYPVAGLESEFKMLVTAFKDSSAPVRYHALNKLQVYPLNDRLPIALEHSKDSLRAVRIGAAELMIEQDLDQLPPDIRGYAIRARQELLDMLFANADFPTGRLQLGDYYYRRNDITSAIKEYEMALKMDSLLTPVYSNLATAYNLTGNNPAALTTLDNLLLIEPTYSRGYYLRGLLNNELGNVEEAIQDLKQAVKLDPTNFRGFYNLANLLFQNGDVTSATRYIKQALQLAPDSEEAQYLLDLIKNSTDT